MWWFGKEKPKEEVWEETIQWPIGDIEAAEKIRHICRSAADSAERIGRAAGPVGGNRQPDPAESERDAERYQHAARAAMEIAMKISDDLMRDAAVREIVDLCVKAKDMRTAPILFRAIQSASIREEVLKDHPVLRQ
jgi:hypothetical protein